MNKRYFLELIDYNIWADNIVIKWLNQINDEQWEQVIISSFSSIRQTAIHIASAKKIWIDFWTNVPNPVFLSAEFKGTKNELIEIWGKSSADVKHFIEKFPEGNFGQQVFFRVRGEEWRMEFWQTFSHFINNATYHRGQLVTMLRQAGFTNFSNTDLATYFRLIQK